jgi:hypothetical protein
MTEPRREIGPVGTASRIVGGLIAIALPIALAGFGWWDAAVALLVLPVVATVVATVVTAAYRRLAPGALSRPAVICSGPACWVVAGVVAAYVGITFITPVNVATAFWVWIGASLLIGAARGYAGCEILAMPNLVTGRRDQIGCLVFTPIDRAEARSRKRVPTASTPGGIR